MGFSTFTHSHFDSLTPGFTNGASDSSNRTMSRPREPARWCLLRQWAKVKEEAWRAMGRAAGSTVQPPFAPSAHTHTHSHTHTPSFMDSFAYVLQCCFIILLFLLRSFLSPVVTTINRVYSWTGMTFFPPSNQAITAGVLPPRVFISSITEWSHSVKVGNWACDITVTFICPFAFCFSNEAALLHVLCFYHISVHKLK